MLPPEQVEAGRQPGDGARRRADGVVNELGPERHVQLEELSARLRGHRDEAVEVPRNTVRSVEVDRVAAAEEAGHHRLCDAGSEAGGDRSVGRRPAVSKDLDSGVRRSRMACGDGGGQHRAATVLRDRSLGRARSFPAACWDCGVVYLEV